MKFPLLCTGDPKTIISLIFKSRNWKLKDITQGILVSTRNRSQMCLSLSAAKAEPGPSPHPVVLGPPLGRRCQRRAAVPRGSLWGWVRLSPPRGTVPHPISGRAAASRQGEKQRTWYVQRGSSLDRSYSLLPECPVHFPGPFVSCLGAREAPGLGNFPEWFFQKRHCYLWGQ